MRRIYCTPAGAWYTVQLIGQHTPTTAPRLLSTFIIFPPRTPLYPMSSNLAPHYDAGEEMEVDLRGEKPATTSAMHRNSSGDGNCMSHHAGVVPRGERCGRCFRNKCVRCVFFVYTQAAAGFREWKSLEKLQLSLSACSLIQSQKMRERT